MQFINQCENGLSVGVLAQFNDQGLISARTTGRVIGVVSRVFQVQTSLDDPTLIDVAEITVGDWANNVILSGSASWQGCNLYANGDKLSATVSGEIIARLVPKTLGEPQADFEDGDLVTVIIL